MATPWKHVSAFAEFRLLPGQTTMGLEFLYSDDDYNYCRVKDTSTAHNSSVLIAGLSVNF
jgi:hypothetical protein